MLQADKDFDYLLRICTELVKRGDMPEEQVSFLNKESWAASDGV
jgi:hypothetical protein